MPYILRMSKVERDEKLTVLLSSEELAKLRQLAEEEGVTVSHTVRALIKAEHARRQGRAK